MPADNPSASVNPPDNIAYISNRLLNIGIDGASHIATALIAINAEATSHGEPFFRSLKYKVMANKTAIPSLITIVSKTAIGPSLPIKFIHGNACSISRLKGDSNSINGVASI